MLDKWFSVDGLNVVLILVSGILAYFFPLELFILSFAILGPLHYFTEINWLNEKQFFTADAKQWLLFGIIASLLLVIPKIVFKYLGDFEELIQFFTSINNFTNGLLFGSFVFAVGLSFSLSKIQKIVLALVSLGLAYILNGMYYYALFFGVLLPTVIHVYIFTLFFMAYGAKKSNSALGFLGVVLALLIPVVYMYINLDGVTYLFPDFLKSVYLDNNLHVTPVLFSKFLGLSDGTSFFFYEKLELRMMMFFSFIYLYHYLNWFSKTTVISWHKSINIKKGTVIVGLWVFMLFLFYIDFTLGFLVSLFFSFLHVILELPLNVASVKGVFSKQ